MPRALLSAVSGTAFVVAVLLAAGSGIRFVDVAGQYGIVGEIVFGGRERKDYILETTGTGVAIFDYDGDGRNDVFLANGTRVKRAPEDSRTASRLYRNLGASRFEDVSAKAGFNHEGWAQAVCVADFDNDGWPDLLETYYGHDILYRNRGDGTFEDVTRAAGLRTSGTRWGAGCSFFDYDRDGRVDLFISNYVNLELATTPKPGDNENCVWKGIPVMCGPRGLAPARNILYHNDGNGKFTDVSEKAGVLAPGARYGLGVMAADFDDDGWPDIYVACDMTPSLLYRNRGNGTFEERGAPAGVAYNVDGRLQAGMGVDVADYDGDGRLDIVKTNFSGDLPSLYRNEDGKFFSDVAREAGLGRHQLLGWGVLFLDVDEDGWKDLVIANGHVYPEVDRAQVGDRYLQPTLLYRNLGNGRFQDWTALAGPAFQVPRPSRGTARGDLDGDGRPEIVIANMNEKPVVLKNEAPGRNWVSLVLVGTKSNRSAIGARVEVEYAGRRSVDEVRAGNSYYSQSEAALFFGLGSEKLVDSVRVRWPSGLRQEWRSVPANRKLVLTEGVPALKPW